MENFSEKDFAKFMAFMRRQQAEETVKETSTTTVTDRPESKEQAAAHQTDCDDEENSNLKSDFIIEERARSLASQEKFYEAASVCEDLTYVDETDIGLKLLKAECYVQLRRESKAEKAIRDIENVLMKPPIFNLDDVLDLAKDYSDNSSCIQALLLLGVAFDVLMKNSSLSPDEKVDFDFCCIGKMDDVMNAIKSMHDLKGDQNVLEIQKALPAATGVNLSKMLGINKKFSGFSERTYVLYLDYGVEAMEKMLKEIEVTKNTNPETKAVKLAQLGNRITLHYKMFRQFSKASKVNQFTVDRLEKQFGENARQYGIYAVTLYNIGSDYLLSEKFKAAESFKIRALGALEYALDFDSEEDKKRSIDAMLVGLKAIRTKLKQRA